MTEKQQAVGVNSMLMPTLIYIVVSQWLNARSCDFPGNHKPGDRVWTASKRHQNRKWPTWWRYVVCGCWYVVETFGGRTKSGHENNLSRLSGGNNDDDEGEALVDGGGQGEGVYAATSANQPGKPDRKPGRLSRKRHRALANKAQDFQVLSLFQLLLSWIIKSHECKNPK